VSRLRSTQITRKKFDNFRTQRRSISKPGGFDLSRLDLDRDSRSRQLQKVSPDSVKIYVSTIEKSRLRRQKSESRQLKNVGLDVSRNLDLDWSRLSRPPGLKIGLKHAFKGDLSDNKNLTCRSCE
jgi:hypothetical protein